jgi:acyl-CoA synthetase (AMP-forming)/AMP-acid ligase II
LAEVVVSAPSSQPRPVDTHDIAYIDTLIARLHGAGDAPVLRYGGQDIGAASLLGSIFRYARALGHIGIGRGSLVAQFAPNHPDALAIRYATNLRGAASVFLSVPASPADRSALLANIDPTLLVLFPETVQLLPEGASVRVATIGVDLPGDRLRLDKLAAAQPDGVVASLARSTDLAVIVSSGGSTGVPKGSLRDFAAYTAMAHVPSPPDRRQLVDGHLAYLSQVLVDMTLLGGGVVVLEDGYEPAAALALIEAERITDLFLVEPQLFELMDHPDLPQRDLSSLRTITHIGASAPATLRHRARERLGAVIAHTYGASEMGLVSMLPPREHDPTHPDVFTSAGHIHPGVDVRFRRDDGTLADRGETGSIEVRSPAMASGYRNRPDLQAAAFQDGWYHTGDLGRLDPDGYLHILGRAVDIVWIDGAMVSPTLIEDTLCQLSTVRYAVVVVDEEAGHWIAAVVPWTTGSIDLAQCRKTVAQAHGVAVAARLVVVPLDRVPLTEQGKPDRMAIRRSGREARLSTPI